MTMATDPQQAPAEGQWMQQRGCHDGNQERRTRPNDDSISLQPVRYASRFRSCCLSRGWEFVLEPRAGVRVGGIKCQSSGSCWLPVFSLPCANLPTCIGVHSSPHNQPDG